MKLFNPYQIRYVARKNGDNITIYQKELSNKYSLINLTSFSWLLLASLIATSIFYFVSKSFVNNPNFWMYFVVPLTVIQFVLFSLVKMKLIQDDECYRNESVYYINDSENKQNEKLLQMLVDLNPDANGERWLKGKDCFALTNMLYKTYKDNDGFDDLVYDKLKKNVA